MFSSLFGQALQEWPYKIIIFHFYEKSLSAKEISWIEDLRLYVTEIYGRMKKKLKEVKDIQI